MLTLFHSVRGNNLKKKDQINVELFTFAKGGKTVPVTNGQTNSFAGSDQGKTNIAAKRALAIDDIAIRSAFNFSVLWSRNRATAAHLTNGFLAGPCTVFLT